MNAVEQLKEAARELLNKGGSITRRNALRSALERIDSESAVNLSDVQPAGNPLTPQAIEMLKEAARVSVARGDKHIRLTHIAEAMQTPTL